MRLALGPVLYYWEREQLLDFYQRMARTEVDIVYLGETVCAKRRALRSEEWLELAHRLAASGKEVVLSTMTLIEAGSELGALRSLCANEAFPVEANDIGAVRLLAGRRPFVTGPAVNIYNARTLDVLARQGLKRWVLPVELSRDTLADMQRQRPQGVETEVFAWGRLPLAWSARCFTARAHNLPKDDCQFRCLDYPDGLRLSTREGQPFLTLNGIQTQSARHCNLIAETGELAGLGVEVLRISPQSRHTETVIDLFRQCLDGRLDAAEADAALQTLTTDGSCNGYWHGSAGMQQTHCGEFSCS
ncbi:MAG TPA: U32 family peptidase [Gammaproteobacteria bacterium]|nr:U32 family peptidase [Gammaproteobacteria bacterium]